MISKSIEISNILLVEDNPDDVFFIKKAFEDAKIKVNINVAKNGIQALSILKKEKSFSNFDKPNLILLDLNMPLMDGRELLQIIKIDEDLKLIPVLILTTSEAPDDIQNCYNLNANAYLTKPANYRDFVDMMSSIYQFWIKLVKLPY